MSTLMDNLPREKGFGVVELVKWNGYWYHPEHLKGIIASQTDFKARDDDIILASSPKTGSTWLTALVACIMSLNSEDDNDPLTTNHPNDLIPSIEFQVYNGGRSSADLLNITSPRLFKTHIPYTNLPNSIKQSDCKVVYITRNPKDTFVSLWHFMHAIYPPKSAPTLENALDRFCRGVYRFGPFFNHVLEYWKAKSENPQKILFVRYEEIKSDPEGEVKKLATFLGRPLANDEDVAKVLSRCSLERLKNMEMNKSGVDPWNGVPKSAFFRKGIVGGWKLYLTDAMSQRLDEISRIHMEESGLGFSF